MNQKKDYFYSDEFSNNVHNLLNRIGVVSGFEIKALEGGRNNKVFCISVGDRKYLLKAYFIHSDDKRDRLMAEFSFSKFAWELGLLCLPKPYIYDDKNQLGIYEFIEGRRIIPKEINENLVNKAIDFFVALNEGKGTPSAKGLPIASEACFCLSDHLGAVKRRLDRLLSIDPEFTFLSPKR